MLDVQDANGGSESVRFFFKTLKHWQPSLLAQDTTWPPIGGTKHIMNRFAGGLDFDPKYCPRLIRKHVPKRCWDNCEPTWQGYQRCLWTVKNKCTGRDGVPPYLLRLLPVHLQQHLYNAKIDIWRGKKIPSTSLASGGLLIYKTKGPRDPKNYRPICIATAIYGILTLLTLKRITTAMTPERPKYSNAHSQTNEQPA